MGGSSTGLVRYVPNTLTTSRIVAAIFLLLLPVLSVPWLASWVWSGISDAADGFAARQLGQESEIGAKVDSIADLVWVAAALFTLLPVVPWSPWMLAWIIAVAMVRVISWIVCWRRFHEFASLHTWANKATGAALFLVPILYLSFGPSVTVTVICVFATLSALEELWLMASMDVLDRDVRGIFLSDDGEGRRAL